ncbi:MAG: ComEC/Rec2 family competence protein [Candidatus Erginobacter occultus]|nr:ComEC/Rec2 family competence protein [Candidatus Erginobacter occultus]
MVKTVYPLVRITLCFILGLVLGRRLPQPVRPELILAAAGLVSFILLFIGRSLSRNFRRVLLWAGLGALAAAFGIFRYSLAGRVPAGDISRYASERPRAVTGTVDGEPDFRRHSVRFRLTCRKTDGEEGEIPVTGRLQVIFRGQVRAAEEILKPGNLVRVTGKITLPAEATNPGETSPRARLAASSIYAESRVYSVDHLELLREASGFSPLRLALGLKRRLAGILRSSLPDRHGHPGSLQSVILEAVMLGERGPVPFEIRDRFRQVGVIHVLVVSGLHVGFIWMIGNFVFSPFPLRVRHALLIPLVAGYVLMTGASTATVRAGVMAGVYSLAYVFNQPRNSFTALAASALFLLLFNPLVLFTAGFQLSFLIVLSIVTVTPLLDRGLRFLPRWLRLTIAVPLAAQLGAIPLVAHYFGFISLPALAANIVIVPLAGLMVGLGFAAGLLGLIALPLARLVNYPNRFLIPLLLQLVGWFSRFPGGYLRVAGFPPLWAAAWYGLLFGLASLPGRTRRGRIRLGSALAVLLLAAAAAPALSPPPDLPPLQAVFFNGRSGQMVLLREQDGPAILISTDDDRFGDIPAIVLPYLDRHRIRKIDFLVLTQAHLDHLNTLNRLREAVMVGTVLDHPLGPSSPSYPRFREVLEENSIPYRRLTGGDLVEAGNCRLEVLWPRKPPGSPFEIDDSLVLRVVFDRVSVLLPSLIGIFAQEDLVAAGADLGSTILQAPRRGSSAHNSPLFLEAVSPAAALLVQGQKYFGRYPRDCGDFLSERGTAVYRTGEEGCLTVETDGAEFRVRAFRPEREEELP